MGKQNASSSTIPFRINPRAPLIVVKAIVNRKIPIDLIVDTGASLTILSRQVAKQAGIRLNGKRAKAAGPDGSQTVTLATVGLFSIGGIQVRNLKVAVMDFALLNRAASIKAGGILGYNLLKRYRVTIDYATRRIRFTPVQPQKPLGSRKPPHAAGTAT